MVHSDKKLYLVFEYLDKDLKKYMDSVPVGGISMPLVKVIGIFCRTLHTFMKYNVELTMSILLL